MKSYFGILFLVLYFLILGCQKTQDDEPIPLIYEVPQELERHIDKFIEEATIREIIVEKENLVIEFIELENDNLCAVCNDNSSKPNVQKRISINKSTVCWFNDEQLETLIFHELGHCKLGRKHTSELLPNGDPKSMMIDGHLELYSPCIYPIGNVEDCNFVFKREYYIDELFDETTPVPEWAK